LTRESREYDLREPALFVLVATGAVEALRDLYDALPPNEREPDLSLRRFLLTQLHHMAAPVRPEEMQAVARRMRDKVEETLESTRPLERIAAAATLLRLGDEGMVDRLLDEFEEAMAEKDSLAAWSAVQLLMQDRTPPRAKDICLRFTRNAARTAEEVFDFEAAVRLLAKGWSGDGEVRSRIYEYLRNRDELDLVPVPYLLAADRPQALEFLRGEIHGDSALRRNAAIRFAGAHPVPEAGAWILELLRRSPDPGERRQLLQGLTLLRTPGTVPMLLAEFEDAVEPEWRVVIGSALLETGAEAALARLAEDLSDGDEAVLDAVFQRALARGGEGLPEALVPHVLAAVREMPGEAGRIKAVLALRGRGRLDPAIREGLIEAYRLEPSGRVAAEIKTALIELAHR
jgi:hypothetical protein